MKYNINKESNKVTINLTLTKEEWQNEVSSAYEQTKGKYDVQGFRKGKAPRKAIENAYGATVFFDTAIDNIFDKNYANIVEKEDLQVIAQPVFSVNKLDDENFDVNLVVEVSPEVKLGAYKGYDIKKVEPKVSEEHIDGHIQEMAVRNARQVEITDRAVENGDIVNLNFSGSIDGKKFEGGTAENYDLEIGSHSFIDTFEDQLIGMQIGEEKEIKVKFPADYFSEDLKGKDAVFACKINKIQKVEMPEINDEWASNVSEFDTLQELRDDIAKHDQEHAKHEAEEQENNELMNKIVEASEVEVPDVLIESDLDYALQDFSNRLMYQGFTLEQYLKQINKTIEQLRDEQREGAKKNVKERLVIQEIIKVEGITVEQADIDAKLTELGARFNKSAEEVKKDFPKEQLLYFKNEILVDKVFAFLRKNNNIK